MNDEARLDALGEETWWGLTYEQRLAITRKLFRTLVDHLIEGGTYRYLIYDRLGFGMDAYGRLMDGLTLSNALHDARRRSG